MILDDNDREWIIRAARADSRRRAFSANVFQNGFRKIYLKNTKGYNSNAYEPGSQFRTDYKTTWFTGT
jgi:hypothetical protein